MKIQPDLKSISVVIPAYNAAKFLHETIASVLAQTYPPSEVIVVDDGSTDCTMDVVRAFGGKVILIEQDNKGTAAARNRGIREARGEYIAFIDHDDFWLPQKLERQIEFLTKQNYNWIYCNSIFFDTEAGKEIHKRTPKYFEGDILEFSLFLQFH